MRKYTCTHCGVELKNRFHSCGIEDGPHRVEIMGGGLWGNPMMGMSGTRDKSVS